MTTQTRRLNSDQLGKKGESRFPELCVDAGLIPNPATWDRKGWDFVVDWPQDDVAPLDRRASPRSCIVQLKTVWQGATSLKMRLSSLEHIAKDIKPAFIYVLEVDDSLSFVGARVIHLEGEFLGIILKRLRQASVDGDQPNNIEMSVSLGRWAAPLEPTGSELRSFLERAIGSSVGTYAERKQKELGELGFESGHLKLTTTFRARDRQHLIDAFLGLEKIDVVNTSAVESRFGIDIPLPALQSQAGQMEISPKPNDRCEILAHTDEATIPIRFVGEMYGVPAPLSKSNQLEVLIRTQFFDLRLHADGVVVGHVTLGLKLSMDVNHLRNVRAKPSDWQNFYSFMDALEAGPLSIEIHPRKVTASIIGQATADFDEANRGRWRQMAQLTAATATLFDRAGSPGYKIHIDDVARAAHEIDVLRTMLTDPSSVTPLTFATQEVDSSGEPLKMDMLYFGYIRFGSHAIAYAAVVDLSGTVADGETHWSGPISRVAAVSRIKANPKAYDQFANVTTQRTGIRSFFGAEMPSRDPPKLG